MPIKISKELPYFEDLKKQGIFMTDFLGGNIANTTESIKIGILNLMPKKEDTEQQLLSILSHSSITIEPSFIKVLTYRSKNVSPTHFENFYISFAQAIQNGIDGIIVTGAPVETLEFEQVEYWEELKGILDVLKDKKIPALFLCWGAFSALYHYFGIKKYRVEEKIFGIFQHTHCHKNQEFLRGMDDEFFAPHSRYAEIRKSDIADIKDLEILSESQEAGLYLLASRDSKMLFVTGHPEYDRYTLAKEYVRDLQKGEKIKIPYNYFPQNDTTQTPKFIWSANAEVLYRNWGEYVYKQKLDVLK